MHNSRDDSAEFQEVKPRHPTHSTKHHVTIIGTSNIMVYNLINCRTVSQQIKLVPTHFSKPKKRLNTWENTPTLLGLHSLTNDLKSKSPSLHLGYSCCCNLYLSLGIDDIPDEGYVLGGLKLHRLNP
jgi:hypothetical protein